MGRAISMNVAGIEFALVTVYFLVLGFLCTFGAHRAVLVYQCIRYRGRTERAQRVRCPADADLPVVTVQLPLYNEATVVARLLEAAARFDYPRDRLEIQVLDDSTDETRFIAERKVQELRATGVDITYVRRPDRHGYKAGALDFGLSRAKGSLIAIFDADFVPQPEFIRAIVGHFQNPSIGMVQTRWGHMNRDANVLTQVQALMLDGHHLVENRARFGAGCFFNFSGTGGMWRKDAIEAAGGWQHDTLTEDLDLSYRAQLAGYRFVYRPDVITPSELPEDMSALRAQQYRWGKGTVQTARKLLRTVLNAPLSKHERLEACFHMLPHFAYPFMMLLSILLLPALVLLPATDLSTMLIVDLPLCVGATGSLAGFYILAEVSQGRSAWGAVRRLPALIALGAGLSPHLTKAVYSGMTSMAGEFVRTPKRGEAAGRYRQVANLPLVEMGLSLLCATSVIAAFETGHWFAAPFAMLFTVGYGYVSLLMVREQLFAGRPSQVPVAPSAELEEASLAEAA
jgi:cellulose synthase/poly-beta-1,6-N-acetylglucosamine synthase-like glycosyltransferase